MTTIGILSFQNGFNKSMQDFYPLIKWSKELKDEGIRIKFYKSHKDDRLLENDIIIISHRYLRDKTLINNIYSNNDFIIKFIERAKKFNRKVLYFDYGASTGCRNFDLIKYVDVFVKRQLLQNIEDYTQESRRWQKIYAWEYDLNEQDKRNLYDRYLKFVVCPHDQLYKLKLGWNTGMTDLRCFPFERYYPISTERLFNKFYPLPNIKLPNLERDIDIAFRGQIKKDKKIFSYQRNKLIKYLKDNVEHNFRTGGNIRRSLYLNELKNSKICVSPYGWGEICYRDFEAAICGCLLIKPTMEHMVTWPNIYEKNKTYIPLRWDMKNLEVVVDRTLYNYENYIELALNLQNVYIECISSPSLFISQFKNLIES